MSFQEIVEFLNFLYSIGMLLELAAFIQLRIKKPDLHRPYKVPLATFGATALCILPALLLVLVMCLASAKTFIVSGGVIIFGFFLYPAMEHAKDQRWVRFHTAPVSDSSLLEPSTVCQQHTEVVDDDSVSLLSSLVCIKKETEGSEVTLEGILKVE